MLTKINAWLANPKRKYKEGLEIFNALASDVQKKNFKEYFEKNKEKVTDQFDIKFTTLVNQISFIQSRVKNNPKAYVQSISTEIKEETETVEVKTEKKTSLDDLPEALIPIRDRIKEIVPLMAKLHADMSNEPADDKRISIIEELIALDDERRESWAKIDNYEPSEEEKAIEAKTVAMGADIQKRIGQVKENIARNEKSLELHLHNNKTTLAKTAEKNIEEYRNKLAHLEALVK